MKTPGALPHTKTPMRRSLVRITLAGSLCMLYVTGIGSPATTEFYRALGAEDIHFGLLSGIPLAMVFFQFVGAAAANRLRRRKPAFMAAFIVGRLIYLPVAFVPLLFPELPFQIFFPMLLGIVALSHGLGNFGSPLWFTWMADLIPRRILNTYWGVRQRCMYIFWTCSFLAVTAFTYWVHWPITKSFPAILTVAVLAGVSDILLFVWVKEPENLRMVGRPIREILLAPLVHSEYRTFVVFSCAYSALIMFSAGFMQPFTLKVLGMPVWMATLVWCVSGVGNALSSKVWGRLADTHGHRPILTLCVFFKPVVAFSLLVVPPRWAPMILPAVFLTDGAWNAGLMVANNGYMMKIAPQQNRSMFVASILGLSGICGGLAAIMGGIFLRSFGDFSLEWMGRTWGNYHLLLCVGCLLRFAGIPLARRIKEPKSSRSRQVVFDVMGLWPLRFVRFPVGLNRRMKGINNRMKRRKGRDAS